MSRGRPTRATASPSRIIIRETKRRTKSPATDAVNIAGKNEVDESDCHHREFNWGPRQHQIDIGESSDECEMDAEVDHEGEMSGGLRR